MPIISMGGRTRRFHDVHLLSLLQKLSKSSCDKRPDRSQRTFVWGIFHPLSGPLQARLCFFYHPLPAKPSTFLTESLPRGGFTGLPSSYTNNTDGLGSLYRPEDVIITLGQNRQPRPSSRLLVQAYQSLWLVAVNDLYQEFRYLSHATKPSPMPPWYWQQKRILKELLPTQSGRYIVRDALDSELPHPP